MTEEKPKPDINKIRDAVIEMAKDLLMIDTAALLASEENGFHWTEKEMAAWAMFVAFHAARGCAEQFRLAHLAEQKDSLRAVMERQLAEELARVDGLSPEEVSARRAS